MSRAANGELELLRKVVSIAEGLTRTVESLQARVTELEGSAAPAFTTTRKPRRTRRRGLADVIDIRTRQPRTGDAA